MARFDTHVVVWLHTDEPILSRGALDALDADPPIVSPMVELELQFLHERGRIRPEPREILGDLEARIGLRTSPVAFDRVVTTATGLTWTRDPFDRLIVADAIAAADRLITRDRRIREHVPDAVW